MTYNCELCRISEWSSILNKSSRPVLLSKKLISMVKLECEPSRMTYFPACITLVALGSGTVSLLCLYSQLFPLKVYTSFLRHPSIYCTDTSPEAAGFISQMRSFKAIQTVMPGSFLAEKGFMSFYMFS